MTVVLRNVTQTMTSFVTQTMTVILCHVTQTMTLLFSTMSHKNHDFVVLCPVTLTITLLFSALSHKPWLCCSVPSHTNHDCCSLPCHTNHEFCLQVNTTFRSNSMMNTSLILRSEFPSPPALEMLVKSPSPPFRTRVCRWVSLTSV